MPSTPFTKLARLDGVSKGWGAKQCIACLVWADGSHEQSTALVASQPRERWLPCIVLNVAPDSAGTIPFYCPALAWQNARPRDVHVSRLRCIDPQAHVTSADLAIADMGLETRLWRGWTTSWCKNDDSKLTRQRAHLQLQLAHRPAAAATLAEAAMLRPSAAKEAAAIASRAQRKAQTMAAAKDKPMT